MGFVVEQRPSDSSLVESVTHGYTVGSGVSVRPAESHWHMVCTRHSGVKHFFVVGPLTTAGVVPYGEGAEILWIKFKLGTFMPNLPTRDRLDSETILPGAASNSFWLDSAAWQFPDYENVDTFINRLVRQELLVHDPVVSDVLQGYQPKMPPRTLRHRFLRATGMTRTQIFQIDRAQRAADLLRQGASIQDTVYDAGYFDQPHLTRALKQWVGHTPAQIVRLSRPQDDFHSVQDAPALHDYHTGMAEAAR